MIHTEMLWDVVVGVGSAAGVSVRGGFVLEFLDGEGAIGCARGHGGGNGGSGGDSGSRGATDDWGRISRRGVLVGWLGVLCGRGKVALVEWRAAALGGEWDL